VGEQREERDRRSEKFLPPIWKDEGAEKRKGWDHDGREVR
jgi:hypothetical protein